MLAGVKILSLKKAWGDKKEGKRERERETERERKSN